ncbi:hypothetical protein OHU17_18665 [Streptomyces goshikiensis]|uniref:Uncharacterized protein n=1 Tax=Streptomyces goshikiensis TaxID=1942 RepID=A0ABZ1RN01_9ACTN|nr:hypothetical protein [Streptomyces goshikiensis]
MLTTISRYLLIVAVGLGLGMALLWMSRTWGQQIGWTAFLAVEAALVIRILLPRRR